MLSSWSSTALVLTAVVSLLLAADGASLAVTRPEQLDEDFALQGEFLGAVSAAVWGCEHVGLQVVALGDGRFQAVLLRGGLPGAGWDRADKIELSGQRSGQRARLQSKALRIGLTSQEAFIRNLAGAELARLPRIQRISATQDAPPPAGAVVLFDGRSTDNLEGATINDEGLLEVGVRTKMPVGDFRMHLEFRTPYMPDARGQGRGNSGVYIQQRYEVQILDSFGLEGQANECGGLYRQKPPDVNMCLPPLSWQTYDIYFTAARFDARGSKVQSARVTVLHNGEPIHTDYHLIAKTGAGRAEGPERFPILLQNHRNPVHFRNIWIVTNTPAVEAPYRWKELAGDCCVCPELVGGD